MTIKTQRHGNSEVRLYLGQRYLSIAEALGTTTVKTYKVSTADEKFIKLPTKRWKALPFASP